MMMMVASPRFVAHSRGCLDECSLRLHDESPGPKGTKSFATGRAILQPSVPVDLKSAT
jgi:hypothetical protein